MSNIQVTIDRLVLRGFDPADRVAFVRGLKRELGRVLAQPDVRARCIDSQRTPVLRLGTMPLAQGPAGAHKLGAGVARAIGKGMVR
jgi:hypothetical protein